MVPVWGAQDLTQFERSGREGKSLGRSSLLALRAECSVWGKLFLFPWMRDKWNSPKLRKQWAGRSLTPSSSWELCYLSQQWHNFSLGLKCSSQMSWDQFPALCAGLGGEAASLGVAPLSWAGAWPAHGCVSSSPWASCFPQAVGILG